MRLNAALAALSDDALEQLRWYVARRLGIAPYCQSDAEVVKCGLHLLSEQSGGGEASFNPAFDGLRFERLREGRADGA